MYYLNQTEENQDYQACEKNGTQKVEVHPLLRSPVGVTSQRHHHNGCQNKCFQYDRRCLQSQSRKRQ